MSLRRTLTLQSYTALEREFYKRRFDGLMDLKHVSCIYRMRSSLLCVAVLLIGIPLGIPLRFFDKNPYQTLCE